MTEPWFDPIRYSWVTGATFGGIALVLGALAAWYVPRGQAKGFIVSAWVSLWAVAIILLITGLVAFHDQQPWGVWYVLLLPGVVGTAVLGGNLLIILKRYREAEQHRFPHNSL
jgi:MFS family permease